MVTHQWKCLGFRYYPTHAHTRAHRYSHTLTHSHTCTHSHVLHTHTLAHTFIHLHIRVRSQSHTRIHTQAHAHSHTHSHSITCSHTLTHSHTHTPPFPAHGGLCHRDRARRWGWLAAPIVCGGTKRLSRRGGHLLLCRVDPKPRPVTGRPAGAGHLGKPPCRSLPCIVQVHPWSPCPGNLCRCPADMGQA